MDRYTPRLIRGLAAAGVSVFLIAGAAFAANAVMGAQRGPSLGLASAATSTGAREVETTETAEPSRTHDATTGTSEPTETERSGSTSERTERANPTEAPEPTETPGPTRHPAPTETAEPAPTSGDEDRSGSDNDGERDGARPALPSGTPTTGATARPEPVRSHDGGGDGSDGGGNG